MSGGAAPMLLSVNSATGCLSISGEQIDELLKAEGTRSLDQKDARMVQHVRAKHGGQLSQPCLVCQAQKNGLS